MTLTQLIRRIHQESDRIDHSLIDEWREGLLALIADWRDAEVDALGRPCPSLERTADSLKRKIISTLS